MILSAGSGWKESGREYASITIGKDISSTAQWLSLTYVSSQDLQCGVMIILPRSDAQAISAAVIAEITICESGCSKSDIAVFERDSGWDMAQITAHVSSKRFICGACSSFLPECTGRSCHQ